LTPHDSQADLAQGNTRPGQVEQSRVQFSKIEMTITRFDLLRNVCAALSLAVWGALSCAGQTGEMADEMALKTTAMKSRAVAEPTIEKLIDLGRLSEARAKLQALIRQLTEQEQENTLPKFVEGLSIKTNSAKRMPK
jgi:hypothetical protein